MPKIHLKENNPMRRLMVKLKLMRDDESGVAALEFAIIAPVLILLFLGTIEISLAIAVDRKVSRISSSIADLITRAAPLNNDLSPAEMQEFVTIANRIMFPYEDQVSVAIVGVDVVDGNSVVRWRFTTGGSSAPAAGQPFPIPDNIKTNGSFIVSAQVVTNHAPAVGFINYDNGQISLDAATIELSEQMFLRPRRTDAFDCSQCS